MGTWSSAWRQEWRHCLLVDGQTLRTGLELSSSSQRLGHVRLTCLNCRWEVIMEQLLSWVRSYSTVEVMVRILHIGKLTATHTLWREQETGGRRWSLWSILEDISLWLHTRGRRTP